MGNMGENIYSLCKSLFPICRSITGNGVRQTLSIVKSIIPELEVVEVPTGYKAFDWVVPSEWNISDAYILDPHGKKIVDFQESNLHVVGYSIPMNKSVSLEELLEHLYSLPEKPDAIPYVTSYYEKRWGFCLTDNLRKSLLPGDYKVYIESFLEEGSLNYGELIIPGELDEEIFLSTYICHPSLANNEISGPAILTYLAKWITSLPHRRYTYRIIFIPETIGSIVYLSKNLKTMKDNVVAGFNLTCLGDDNSYSFLPSRYGGTLADRVALHVLKHTHPEFKTYSYLDRASDERQYCSPGIDLPVVSVMRTKYNEYPEYHNSLDNLSFISPKGLAGGYMVLKRCIKSMEINYTYRITTLCEPHLGKRGLYPTLSKKSNVKEIMTVLNLLTYSDGINDLLQIAEIINKPIWVLSKYINVLKKQELIKIV